jgi:hypothetical protein
MRADDPDELAIQCWPIKILAKGRLAIIVMAVPITLLLSSVAWRITRTSFGF